MTPSLLPGQCISGTVSKLVFGGLGLVRHEGMVIFVPGVIADEEISLEIVVIKARYATGKLLAIKKASPNRIQPLCPYFGTCGGCQIQHIDPAIHSSIKCQWLREAMHGILPTDFSIGVIPAKRMWEWRRKITLHVHWDRDHWICGYIALDNRTIVQVDWCPIFLAENERSLIPQIRALFQNIPGAHGTIISVTCSRLPNNSLALLLKSNLHISRATQETVIAQAAQIPSIQSLSLRFHHLSCDRGPTDFTCMALGHTWHYSQEAFIQNHPEQGERLWADSIQAIDRYGTQQTILDLYSGIGVTAISLARMGHRVTAVERSRAAVAAARQSAADQQVDLRLIEDSVENYVQKTTGEEDWWIVNPPRQGLSKEVLATLIKKRPKRILYISCSPSTMARDLKHLLSAGRHVVWTQMYDLFPQTTNLETVAIIE